MKVIRAGQQVVGVELTRRNLRALLNKLDFNQGLPPEDPRRRSDVMIAQDAVFIKGVEDDDHYGDREAGEMVDNETGELY